jgi:6-phosphogluconolactonase (cycloisomerase 2 family)
MTTDHSSTTAAVYVQTNAADNNEVLAFERREDGKLVRQGRFATGGRGTGSPHLPSQSSMALSDDGQRLLVVNAGSDELSLFSVEDGGLALANCVASGGTTPTSVALSGNLVYVLNNGTPNIAGFRIDDGRLVEMEESTRPLSADDADPAQISFSRDGRTLVVTERGTDSISAYAIDDRGYADGPTTIKSTGKTPYGFDFRADGALIVTEAFGGDIGAAAASSYSLTDPAKLAPVSGSVADTRSEVCWAAITNDGRFAYVTNFGDGTISSYEIAGDGSLRLRNAVAGSTRPGEKGIRDEAISRDGQYLYAIDTDAQRVFGWTVGSDGELSAVGEFEGVPKTVAGLAAS